MTDEEINACWKDPGWPSDCGHCPARALLKLTRAEWARHLSPEPPEEVKE